MILNIRKSDGTIVDVGQHYDERFFENREVPDDEAPKIHGKKAYVLDKNDDTIKEQPRSVPLQPTYVMLMDKQPYGKLHAHPNDQLVVVINGTAEVAQGKDSVPLFKGESLIIPKDVDHLITGAMDHTLILTVQV